MTHTHPEIEPLLARLCGGALTTEDYVGYFQNEYGGQLVFAQRRGDKTAGSGTARRTGTCTASVTIR